MLGQDLRDVEATQLSEDEQVPIDDAARMIGSPVFLDLAGTTTARSILEAMITHSDNTATDIATMKVGADRVRALIVQAGLPSIRIPEFHPHLLLLFPRRTCRRGPRLARDRAGSDDTWTPSPSAQ